MAINIVGHGGCAVCYLTHEIFVGGPLHWGGRRPTKTFNKIVEGRRFVSYGDIYEFRVLGPRRGGARLSLFYLK